MTYKGLLKVKKWNKKQVKLYKAIIALNLSCSVSQLWEFYLQCYFPIMDIGAFCKALKNREIKYGGGGL